MQLGEKFYSKRLKRTVFPGEEIYLRELKTTIEERISYYRNAGCGAGSCNPAELILRNELNRIQNVITQCNASQNYLIQDLQNI